MMSIKIGFMMKLKMKGLKMSKYVHSQKVSTKLEIAALKARIDVLNWDALGGQVSSWYAYNEIAELEIKLEELETLLSEL